MKRPYIVLYAFGDSGNLPAPSITVIGDKINDDENDNYPPPPSLRSSSRLSQGDRQYGVYSFPVVTDSTPETGGVPRRGEGVDGFPSSFLYLTQRPQRAQSFYFPFIFHTGAEGGRKLRYDKVRKESYPPPPLRSSALSQGGQLAGAVFSVVTDSTPETGVVPRRGEGVDSFHLSVHHAAGIFTCRSATINRGKATLTSINRPAGES